MIQPFFFKEEEEVLYSKDVLKYIIFYNLYNIILLINIFNAFLIFFIFFIATVTFKKKN